MAPRRSSHRVAEVAGSVHPIAARQRLDVELVRRKLADSRQQARALVEEHQVRVNGAFADKASRLVDRGDSIEVAAGRPQFVGRGGHKLAGALDAFDVDPVGRRGLDVGASTGGFTDCLLQRGASSVVAVDVGYGQLHESLVRHERVTNLDRTNVRGLSAHDIGGPVDLVVGDLSFISLRTVIGPIVALAQQGADLVLLVKPQFEAGRAEASRGRGIIRDPAIWQRVLEDVAAAARDAGAGVQAAAVSPIRGGDGNVEFFLHLVVGADAVAVDLAELAASVDEAGGQLS